MRRINDEAVRQMHELGLSHYAIASKLRVSRSAVGDSCRRQGLKPHFAPGRCSKEALRAAYRKATNKRGQNLTEARWSAERVEILHRWPGGQVTAAQARILDVLEVAGSLTTSELFAAACWDQRASAPYRLLRLLTALGLVEWSHLDDGCRGRPQRLWSLAGPALEAARRRAAANDLN